MEPKMSTKAADTDVTPSAYRPPSSDGTKEIARMFADLLAQMRNDPLLRQPTLSQAALDAIVAYEVTSGAVNPVKASSIVTGAKAKGG